jgi:hypothetical protein
LFRNAIQPCLKSHICTYLKVVGWYVTFFQAIPVTLKQKYRIIQRIPEKKNVNKVSAQSDFQQLKELTNDSFQLAKLFIGGEINQLGPLPSQGVTIPT